MRTKANDPVIQCPRCTAEFPLTETLAAPLLDAARADARIAVEGMQAELAKRQLELARAAETVESQIASRVDAARTKLRTDLETQAREQVSTEIEDLRRTASEQAELLKAARTRELEVLSLERQLHEREEELALELHRLVAEERESIARAARAKADQAVAVELGALQEELHENRELLKASRDQQLDLMRKARDLETATAELTLEKERQLDAERADIRAKAQEEVREENRLREAEKDKLVQDLRKQIDEVQRKAEQGSQQLQGEVQELELEDRLRLAFPRDEIRPVQKGVRGGDCIQRILGPTGQFVATILWESKRTKAWNEAWIEKLRDDQRASQADAAILATAALPRDVRNFGHANGVWVTDFEFAIPLAQALRLHLLELAAARIANAGRDCKKERIYEYLCGPQFRQRVLTILEAFQAMKADLEAERRAFTKHWARREKQLGRLLEGTAGMYGDLEGISGESLAALPDLDVESLAEEPDAGRADAGTTGPGDGALVTVSTDP